MLLAESTRLLSFFVCFLFSFFFSFSPPPFGGKGQEKSFKIESKQKHCNMIKLRTTISGQNVTHTHFSLQPLISHAKPFNLVSTQRKASRANFNVFTTIQTPQTFFTGTHTVVRILQCTFHTLKGGKQ